MELDSFSSHCSQRLAANAACVVGASDVTDSGSELLALAAVSIIIEFIELLSTLDPRLNSA